ncbi:MAG: FAD-binding oxidoreductase [Sulfolobales archaeon]|nr:FAD-binding oxidoreductase [Sulfolobales archaeon]
MECERPRNLKELIATVLSHESVHFVGFGRHLITEHEGHCVSLSEFNRVLEVSNSDLYVTVEPGAPVNEIKEVLRTRNLFLPVHHDGSVGGLLGLNLPSEFSFWFGYPSDLVLEAKTLTGLGEVVRTGAKTPKFSSGYKVYKALAGALGLLGAYLEATLRVFPRPEVIAYLKVRNGRKALESPVRPWGGIVRNFNELETFVTVGGWREKADKAEEALNALSSSEERPGLEEAESCSRVVMVSVPRGLEEEYLAKLGRGYAFLGSGALFLCDPDVRALRDKGFIAIITKNCSKGEDCFGFRSPTLRKLSSALDPKGKFITIRPPPW